MPTSSDSFLHNPLTPDNATNLPPTSYPFKSPVDIWPDPVVLTAIQELSRCERKVLKLIGEGLTTPQIAEKLFRSEKTIETQRSSLSRQLKLKGANSLILFAATYKAYL